jgi:hypothetical protein
MRFLKGKGERIEQHPRDLAFVNNKDPYLSFVWEQEDDRRWLGFPSRVCQLE